MLILLATTALATVPAQPCEGERVDADRLLVALQRLEDARLHTREARSRAQEMTLMLPCARFVPPPALLLRIELRLADAYRVAGSDGFADRWLRSAVLLARELGETDPDPEIHPANRAVWADFLETTHGSAVWPPPEPRTCALRVDGLPVGAAPSVGGTLHLVQDVRGESVHRGWLVVHDGWPEALFQGEMPFCGALEDKPEVLKARTFRKRVQTVGLVTTAAGLVVSGIGAVLVNQDQPPRSGVPLTAAGAGLAVAGWGVWTAGQPVVSPMEER